MNKHSVTINGEVFTRNSKSRKYTHAIACWANKAGRAVVLGWAGSTELANKAVRNYQSGAWKNAQWSNVTAVPNGFVGEVERD